MIAENIKKDGDILIFKSVINVRLTKLQTNILRYKAMGYTAQEIAGELDYSKKYIETEWQTLKQSLYFKSRKELVLWLIDNGLVIVNF